MKRLRELFFGPAQRRSPGENARSIGRRLLDQLVWEALGFYTSRSLLVLFGYVGLGMNGKSHIGFGSVWGTLVMR
jgi:hypothetical protein